MGRPFILGIDCAIYYQPWAQRAITLPTQFATPWDFDMFGSDQLLLIPYVREATVNLTSNTADVTTRASNRWTQNVQTRLDGSVDFTILWRPDDAYFTELLARYMDGCPMAMFVLDGKITWSGSVWAADESIWCSGTGGVVSGWYADFAVTSFSRPEPLDEGLVANVTIQPSVGAIYPQWFAVDGAGNVIVY